GGPGRSVVWLFQRQPWRNHLEIEIGRGKKGRRAYGFDDIAIVPSRRTRDPDDIDISWTLGPYRFELPLVASAMDGVVSPDTAVLVNELGGVGGGAPVGRSWARCWPWASPLAPRSWSTSSAGSACSTWRGSGPASRTPRSCWRRS